MNYLSKPLILAFLLISAIGVADTSYLTYSHYTGIPLNCSVLQDCDIVTTSKYSQIGPVPLAVLGLFFYSSLFLITAFYKETKNNIAANLMIILPFAGLVSSAYFVYLQVFVLKALCQYCMLSAATSTLLAVLSSIILIKEYAKKEEV